MTVQQKLYEILKISDKRSTLSHKFDIFLITLILLNALALTLETVKSIYQSWETFFYYFDLFSILFFTLEYLLRVWTITQHPRYQHSLWGRLAFVTSPLAIIDLLAFLPFYLPFFGIDLRFIRVLRVFRLLRIFRVARYIKALYIIHNVFRRKREELFISLIFVTFILIITSCFMYYIEHEARPETFSSIPATMW